MRHNALHSVAGGGAAAANLTFTADADTIDPSITLDGGAPDPDWLVVEDDGSESTYSTASFEHTRTDPGPVVVTLRNSAALVGYLTEIDFRGGGITSTLSDLSLDQFVDTLTELYLFSNPISSDISALSNLTSLTVLHLASTSVSGDISVLSNLANVTDLLLHATSVSGDISALSNLANVTRLYLHSTDAGYDGVDPALSPLAALDDFRIDGCSLTESEVDAILLDLYDGADTRTATGGSINVGGNNAAPSGTHQAAASCPVDGSTPGKEVAHELANDGCGAGITVWDTVTFTS